MRNYSSFWQFVPAAAAAAIAATLTTACKPNVQPSGPPKLAVAASKTNVVAAATNQPSLQYHSEFVELTPPKGRDPFFPNSHRRDPAAAPTTSVAAVVVKPPPAEGLVLQGLSGAVNNRVAVIGGGSKNAVLQVGDSGTVHLPGGIVRVKCLEIGQDYALIEVVGESEQKPQQKRLELIKKGL